MVAFFVSLFVPHKVTDREGPRWFRTLVCNPMPASVTNLTAQGTTMFTGKWVRLDFTASHEDLATVVTNGAFIPWDGFVGDAAGIRRMSEGLTNPQVFLKRNAAFNMENARQVTLILETNRGLARVDYFRP